MMEKCRAEMIGTGKPFRLQGAHLIGCQNSPYARLTAVLRRSEAHMRDQGAVRL